MSVADITNDVNDRLASAPGLPPLFFDNIDADVPAGEHLRPYILPANTESLGLTELDQEQGVIQVSVFVPKGVGTIQPAETAKEILDLFPRNLELPSLRIDAAGSVAPPLYREGWYVTPVTIPYQQLT